MHIPFLPRADAEQVLEDEFHADEARGEFLAEYASSAFFGGADATDAMIMARTELHWREQDFDASEDAPEYYARLEAARLFAEVGRLELLDHEVPEYYGGSYLRTDIFSTHDDIPF